MMFMISCIGLNAQYDQNKLRKFVKTANENIELIHQIRRQADLKSEDYDEKTERVISPFLDYNFEILEPFAINNYGQISMKLKYLDEENPFIYSVKGDLNYLNRAVVDIYFILEFQEDSLTVEYQYLNTGMIETVKGNLLHLGMDQSDLIHLAQKAGIECEIY